MYEMQTIVTDVHGVCLSVYQSVCLSYGSTWLYRAKTAEEINILFNVRPSTSFSADTDTPIFCCHPMLIPIRFKSGRGAA